MNRSSDSKDSIVKYAMFLFNPIIGFVVSLKNINTKSSYLVFFLFSILFGISFVVPSGRAIARATDGYTGDGVVYREKFEKISTYKISEFQKLVNDYLAFDEGDKDFYVLATSFLVSRFSTNYHWVFGIYAIVFAYFLLKSLRFLTEEDNFKNSFYCFLMAVMFVMSNPIFNINGVRFWTAAWIGVYSLFHIFRNNNKRYLILASITPLIHVSFFVYLFVLMIALLFRKYNRFWFTLFVISFFVSEISFLILESVESYFPEFISRTIRLYTDTEVMALKEESKVWYADVFSFLPRLIVNLIVVLYYRNRKFILENPKTSNLYLFLIVWMTFVNFTTAVPSLGGRFFQLAIPIIVYIWLMTFNSKKYSYWIKAYFLAFAPSYIYIFRLIFKVTEIEFYVTNPFYLIYNYLII